MADITFTTVTATLQEPAAPLIRQSAFEHVARLMQALRRLLPQGACSAELDRRSDALLRDMGLTREQASAGAMWRHCE